MEELVLRAKDGDKEAFVELMEINKTDMYKTARSILNNDADVADAMQETVMAAYKSIRGLKEKQYFKTWLIRILINKCKDIMKQNKKYEGNFDDSGMYVGEFTWEIGEAYETSLLKNVDVYISDIGINMGDVYIEMQ